MHIDKLIKKRKVGGEEMIKEVQVGNTGSFIIGFDLNH
jgi:hypothetical protein